MKKTYKYRIAQSLSVIVLLLAEFFLSLILFWLANDGVIGCGRGAFDSPTWPLDMFPFVAIPLGLMAGAVTTFLWCSSRVTAVEIAELKAQS